ncbi:Ribonuclease BN [bacterium HR09]|nr:Ribonuclease BN [bacterium HR09]
MRRLELQTSWGKLLLVGGSRAGEGTVVVLPQFRLALDAGFPLRALVPMEHVVVSHGHTDHLAGLLPWAAQRQLQNLGPARVYALDPLAQQLRQFLALGAAMENGKPYPVDVVTVREGQTLPLRSDCSLRFFLTSHWTPTLGVVLSWTKRQLKREFSGLPPESIRELRQKGVEVSETVETPLLAYLADTGPEVLERESWLAQVEVLVVECTFLKPQDRERARRFGHMHLEDLRSWLPHAQNRHWVLTHLSRRHRLAGATKTIRQALASGPGPKLHLLNVEWP